MSDMQRELERRNSLTEREIASREKIASGWQVVTFMGLFMAAVVAVIWALS